MDSRRCSVSSQGLDRFIPHRPSLDCNAAHARIMSRSPERKDVHKQLESKNEKRYQRLLSDAMNVKDGRILPMTSTPVKNSGPFTMQNARCSPSSPDEGYYSPGRENSRRVPKSPECIMDMPGLRDDFYTNVLDWNSQNLLAVALHQSLYVWNATTKECQRLEIRGIEERLPEDLFVSALSWSPSKPYLAVADSYGKITVFDLDRKLHICTILEEMETQGIVGALQWTDSGLISGSYNGAVNIFDIRVGSPGGKIKFGQLLKEKGKPVCGVQQCPGTTFLACGADSGRVTIWDLRMEQLIYKKLQAHTACVKALAWCPWRSSILATGGGSSDGHIRVWHVPTGEKKNEVDTKSQVCALLWPEDYGELVSANGSATQENNNIILWRMRRSYEFEPQACLRHHTARPLHLALSPDKTTVASAGADEALCLWKCFPKRGTSAKSKINFSTLNMFHYIR